MGLVGLLGEDKLAKFGRDGTLVSATRLVKARHVASLKERPLARKQCQYCFNILPLAYKGCVKA